jgi:hypothetical protein
MSARTITAYIAICEQPGCGCTNIATDEQCAVETMDCSETVGHMTVRVVEVHIGVPPAITCSISSDKVVVYAPSAQHHPNEEKL